MEGRVNQQSTMKSIISIRGYTLLNHFKPIKIKMCIMSIKKIIVLLQYNIYNSNNINLKFLSDFVEKWYKTIKMSTFM